MIGLSGSTWFSGESEKEEMSTSQHQRTDLWFGDAVKSRFLSFSLPSPDLCDLDGVTTLSGPDFLSLLKRNKMVRSFRSSSKTFVRKTGGFSSCLCRSVC